MRGDDQRLRQRRQYGGNVRRGQRRDCEGRRRRRQAQGGGGRQDLKSNSRIQNVKGYLCFKAVVFSFFQ